MFLIALAVVLGLGVNWLSPVGIALVGRWDVQKGAVSAGEKGDVEILALEISDMAQAKAIYDRQIALFVDARSKALYDEGHIKGALSLPVGQLDRRLPTFFKKYPPDTAIVTYCSGRTCVDSHKLAKRLRALGYERVQILIDGYPDWAAAGYPLEK